MSSANFYVYDSIFNRAIPSTQIRIYSVDGSQFITVGTTDDNGLVPIELDDGEYWIRFFKSGYSFPTRKKIVLNGNASFDVPGIDLVETPPSRAEGICRASGYLLGAGGEPVSGVSATFMLKELPVVVGRDLVVLNKIGTKSDGEGRIEIELIQGATYDLVLQGYHDEIIEVWVPETEQVYFTDLIYPTVSSISLEFATLVMAVGDKQPVKITETLLSNGMSLPHKSIDGRLRTLRGFTNLTSTDSKVASVSYTSSDKIEVTAESSGTATIRFRLKPSTIVPRYSPSEDLATIQVTVL